MVGYLDEWRKLRLATVNGQFNLLQAGLGLLFHVQNNCNLYSFYISIFGVIKQFY